MIKTGITALIAAALLAGCSTGGGGSQVLLDDNFDRADAETVGNGWKVHAENDAAVTIEEKAAVFTTTDEEFQPSLTHQFAEQKSGKLSASFVMNWIRDYEGDWAFFIQLGNSKEMGETVADLTSGAAVNLVWGGGFSIDHDEISILASYSGGEATKLVALNDSENEATVIKNALITIDVDLDKKTYSVKVGDKVFKDIKFDSDVSVDTIRFIAHNMNPDNFSNKSIDNVKVIKK